MFIRIGYRIAKVGNFFLGTLAAIIAMVAFAFGTYSLWDMYMTNQGAFTSSDILKYKPASTSEGDNLTLGELRKINNETVAWITVYGTNIDYPIVQGKDNAKYVNTDIYGEFSLSGSIFLSYENQFDFSDSYNVMFGHHMASGAMFGDVSEFTARTFFDKHRWGILFTEQETYDVHFFAVMNTVSYDYEVYYPKKYTESENIPKLLSYIKDKSMTFEDIGFEGDNKIVALSTCKDASTNGRTVLFGKMIKRVAGVDNPEVPEKVKNGDLAKDSDGNGEGLGPAFVLGAKSGSIRYMALFNLLCVVIILLLAIFVLFQRNENRNRNDSENDNENDHENNNESENENEKQYRYRKRRGKIFLCLDFVVSLIVFILTEDIRNPICIFDWWSILMAIFLIAAIVILIVGKRDKNDEEEVVEREVVEENVEREDKNASGEESNSESSDKDEEN